MTESSLQLMYPRRLEKRNDDGTWTVRVVPPAATGFSASELVLTQDQYERYVEWLDGDILLQTALPDLTDGQREMLQSGINEEEFDATFGDDK